MSGVIRPIFRDIVEYVEDLIQDTDRHVVVMHNCNCQNTMGAGVAKVIATAWPEFYSADLKTEKGDKTKLGRFSTATVERHGRVFTGVNLYGQYRYGSPKVSTNFDIDAFEQALTSLADLFYGQDVIFVFPPMGAVLAGGNWRDIAEVITRVLKGHDLRLVRKPR